MRRNLFLILATCMMGMMAVGCSQGDNPETPIPDEPVVPSEPTKIPINVSTKVWTRATDSAFETNDKVGIYVVNYNGTAAGALQNTGNHVDNMRFTYTSSWEPDTPIYWKDQTTPADFYCYYPYSTGIANVSAYPFAVQTNQSNRNNYKASDFLWGKREGVAPTAETVQISVHHVMSNLIIKLQAGTGYKEADMERANITIKGLKNNATINLANGVATAVGEVSDILPVEESGYFRALVVPQSISNADLIEISLDGYHYKLTQTMTFESNKQHTCTLTVNRMGEGINIGIGQWETDEKDYGGTV